MKLVILKGSNVGQEFPLDKAIIRIGRGPNNDIILSDSQLSRQHAEIRRQGDQFFIADLGSTNGTFLNEQRIHQPQVWPPGAQVRIGSTVLAVREGDAVPVSGPTDYLDEYDGFLESGAPPPVQRRSGMAMWLVAGGVALLAVIIAGGLLWLLLPRGNKKGTATPSLTTVATSAIVMPSPSPPATPTTEVTPSPTEPPTVTPLIEPVATLPSTPAVPPPPPPPAQTPPMPMPTGAMPEQMPTGFPSDVPPEQIPTVMATMFPNMPPEQIPTVMATMFPGMSPQEIATVVAPLLPYMPPEVATVMAPGGMPPTGPATGHIAYSVYDTTVGQYDVYLIPATGGAPVKLISEATDPHISPDGQRVAYRSWRRDALGLHVMNVDGSGDTVVTRYLEDRYPRWSPDGQHILFSSEREGDRISRVYVMKPDGTELRTITEGRHGDWSPQGDRIVYQGCVGGSCGLRLINLDGSNPSQITTDATDSAPTWSPDGLNIAFQSQRDGNWELYVIKPDGTWLRRVTQNSNIDGLPAWSPAGTHLAFLSDREGAWAIWTTGALGPPAFQLIATHPGDDWGIAGLSWVK